MDRNKEYGTACIRIMKGIKVELTGNVVQYLKNKNMGFLVDEDNEAMYFIPTKADQGIRPMMSDENQKLVYNLPPPTNEVKAIWRKYYGTHTVLYRKNRFCIYRKKKKRSVKNAK